jgi:cystathionine beta-synthase
MEIHQNILELIGQTPIIKLNKVAQNLPFDLFAKVEYFNPGSSVKDRIAVHIINEAEKRGDLKPGGTIVEATSGNTGMGLALVAAVRGYKAIFVMPDKMSNEKISALRAFGAKVVVTPTNVEPDDPRSYYCVSRRIAEETPNAFYANQYHNPDNPQAHYMSTGPEIWEQTGGKITAFIAGLGTGGTITGTARYLKEKNPKIRIIGIDPEGSVYTELKRTGKMGPAYPYKVEGVGEDFLPSTIDINIVDEVIQVSDKESMSMTRALARREGLFVGGSCGFAVAGALKWAQAQKSKEFPLVLLPDSGSRYLSKIFNDDWMRENGFLDEPEIYVSDVFKSRSLVTTTSEATAGDCIELLKKHSISQLPVLKKDGGLEGIITESDLLLALSKDPERGARTIKDLVVREVETVKLTDSLSRVQEFLKKDFVPVVVHESKVLGVITKIDILDFFLAKGRPQ